jgi:hypothetical protein
VPKLSKRDAIAILNQDIAKVRSGNLHMTDL